MISDRQDLHEDNNALVFWKKHRIISFSPGTMIIIEILKVEMKLCDYSERCTRYPI